jgi:predicted RNA-binding protein with PUA-like domain
VKDGGTFWSGVRNYTARNNLKAMKKGDRCFIYHSVGPREIVGVAEVTKEAYPDPTVDAQDPEAKKGWVAVDIRPTEKLKRPVSLDAIKGHKLLKGMVLVKQSRLSVCPVKPDEEKAILALSR